jgi:hypothetical protein
METRHQNIIPIDDLIVVDLPLKQVCLNLLGEALADPRNLLPFGVRGIHGSLVEEKAKGIAKAFERGRSSGSIGSRKREFNAFEALLDHRDGVLELGEEEADDDLAEVRKTAEVTLRIRVEL